MLEKVGTYILILGMFLFYFCYATTASACRGCYDGYYGYSYSYATNRYYGVGNALGNNNYYPSNQPFPINATQYSTTSGAIGTNGYYYNTGANIYGTNQYIQSSQTLLVNTTQLNTNGGATATRRREAEDQLQIGLARR